MIILKFVKWELRVLKIINVKRNNVNFWGITVDLFTQQL